MIDIQLGGTCLTGECYSQSIKLFMCLNHSSHTIMDIFPDIVWNITHLILDRRCILIEDFSL